MLKINTKAPEFKLSDETGEIHTLSDYKGKYIILYFYPKDDTPGCTTEALMFKKILAKLQKMDVIVFGISADTVESHKKFKKKLKLNFPLLSDVEKKVIKAYDAWGQKKFMGRTYDGILRNSILISPEGKVLKIYQGVKPLLHAEEVFKDIKELKEKK